MWSASCLCEVPHLSLGAPLWAIGILQGDMTQAAIGDHFSVHRNTVFQCLRTNYQDTGMAHDRSVPESQMWCHRFELFATGSLAYTVAFRLLVPHLEGFWGYMQSVSELYPTICGNTAFAPAHNDVIKWKHFPRYWPFVPPAKASDVEFWCFLWSAPQ